MEIGIFYANIKEAYSEIKDDLVLLEKVKELGYSFVDIDFNDIVSKTPDFFDRANELEIGFSVYCFADENCNLKDGSNIGEYLPFLKEHRVYNLMMVCRPEKMTSKYDETVRGAIVKSMNLLCEKAKDYDITILVEDFDNSIPCGNTEDMLYFSERIPFLKFTFDTGNFAYFGESAIESYEKLKSKIGHVHLKDRISVDNLKVTPVGKGGLPISEIIDRLISDGYDKKLSVEMFDASSDPKFFRESFDYVSKKIKR